jgi:Ca2+-binding RTX toxin-like protein
MTYAGDGGSSLWGGNGFASDTLVGGAGVDSFICSKNQGADLILNAAPKDTIYFNDATLSDIVSAAENNLTISITFNTGNVVTVRSPEFLSAKFALADGNAYRFNHIARNWQKA